MAEQIDPMAKQFHIGIRQARRELKKQHARESRHKVKALLRHGEYDGAQDLDVLDNKYGGWLS